MPRDQKPAGEHALSNAERQARYRARHLTQPPPVVIADSGDLERSIRSILNTDSGDHERRLARA